jgi:tetratricopeptide (TPR) repeat protein
MKQRASSITSPVDLKTRVERAAREGRTQQALELAKQLYAGDKSPTGKELLLKAYLARARQLRGQGQTRDAAIVLGNTLALVEGMPAWGEQVAEEYAACGQPAPALKLIEWLPESPARARILARAADAALAQGPAGRTTLPEELWPGFDRIVLAFDQLHTGQDEAARQTLQEIGLQSPFLEWKLLLRGLQAYYQGEDGRALENWTRLSADRLPCRLASPLRFHIDNQFRAAQPPATQAALQKQGDRLQGSPLLALLRPFQAALANEELDQAFQLAGSLLPHLSDNLELARRLAACCYAAIARVGSPKDLGRYRRTFPPPPDDPDFHRLEALASERANEMDLAHKEWHAYEQWVASQPEVWNGQAQRARALIWCRMAENAADTLDADKLEKLPSMIRNMAPKPQPLQPPADECFRRSLELAPDLLATHEALVDYYRERHEDDRADAAARQLLKHFPDHAPTLLYLGDRSLAAKKPADALAMFERARQASPLDRNIRERIGVVRLRLGRAHMEARSFEQARSEFQAGVDCFEGAKRLLPLCQWTVCEFHAGELARAETLLNQARVLAGHPLPPALAALAESIRSKLAAPLKRRFEKEFAAEVEQDGSFSAAVLCLEVLASYQGWEIKYRGQKTHENRIVAYLDNVPKDRLEEGLLERACASLILLRKFKAARTQAGHAARLFPRNPWFPFLEAESYIAPDPENAHRHYRVRGLLNRARELAEELPAGERRDGLLQEIDMRQELFKATSLMGNPYAILEMLDSLRDEDDCEDDDD